MIEPKEVELTAGGATKRFILTKFPAIAGREIVAQYPLSGLPKLGDYKVNEEIMVKLMTFVGVPIEGREQPLMLSNRSLVDNHVPNWELLVKIEIAMMEYNCSFFQNGRISSFFADFAQNLLAWTIKTLTPSLQSLSQKVKQHFRN